MAFNPNYGQGLSWGGSPDQAAGDELGGGLYPYETLTFGGKIYRFDPGSGELIELAADTRGGEGRAPQYTVDERTGTVVPMTPGAQVGFAGIDPREKYGNELQQTGFTNQMQQRAQALNELENAQANVIRMAQMAEEAKMGRAQLGESRANRGEQARQANLRAAVDQWQTAMNLIPQMGQLSLQESERVQGILSGGGDFLARAFESRGGSSPLAKVTQADQINALGQSMQTLRNMVQTNMAPVSSQYDDMSQNIGAYEAPQLSQGFSAGAAGGMPMPQAPNFQLSPTPAPSPAPAGGSGGGGGLAAAASTPTGDADMGVGLPYAQPGNPYPSKWDVPSPPGNDPYPYAWDVPRAPSLQPTSPQVGLRPDTSRRKPSFVDQINPFDDAVNLAKGVGSGIGRFLNPNKYPRGFEAGGYTTEPVFLGNEEGAELFVNPTNAPIQILPADDTKKMGFSQDTAPGYDEGTAGSGMMLRPQPTGGFWNSLMESLQIDRGQNMAHTQNTLSGLEDADYAGMAAGMFGPGGGGFAGKAAPIDPQLIRQALSEMRRNDILRRIEQGIEMGREVPGFATGTGYEPEIRDGNLYARPTGAPAPVAGNQYGSTGFSGGSGGYMDKGAYDQRRAGMSAAYPGFNFMTYEQATGPSVYNNSDGSSRVKSQAGTWINNLNQGEQMQKSFAEAAFYKKNGRMPSPGELNSQPQPAYKPVTQKELIEMGRKNLPPAVSDVLGGKPTRAVTALESQAVPGNFLKTITARQLQSLSPEEIQAMGTMTNTEFNAPLSYVLGRTQAQYGPSQEMRRGFLKGAL